MIPLVLASKSAARHRLMEAAGFTCETRDPAVDEDEIKRALKAENADAVTAALTLAEAKARKIEAPGKLVIAADQMLSLGSNWLNKSGSERRLREQLMQLSGQTHELTVGCVIFENGAEIWRVHTVAYLTMRTLSAADIDSYIHCVGDAALSSVGGYQIEGVGVRLFTRITGDLFTIQGLPILEIGAFLYDRGYRFGNS